MSPKDGIRGVSSAPRSRATADTPSPAPGRARWAALAALTVAVVWVSLAALGLRGDDAPEPTGDESQTSGTSSVDARALMHARVACDFAGKAEQAATAPEVEERARYAVAVLLLDQAIIESARAAEFDIELDALDSALQTAHTAGHRSNDDEWQSALRSARVECRRVAD